MSVERPRGRGTNPLRLSGLAFPNFVASKVAKLSKTVKPMCTSSVAFSPMTLMPRSFLSFGAKMRLSNFGRAMGFEPVAMRITSPRSRRIAEPISTATAWASSNDAWR